MINEKIHNVPFEVLHGHLKGVIERYAFYMTRSRRYVEDTTQEIFLRLWLKWSRLSELTTDELEDYIYVMTRNYLINEQKAAKRGRAYSSYYTHCVSECCWHDEAILKDGYFIYKKAVKELPFKEKAVFMYFANDYSREEIAQIVGRSPNTINNQLRSASQAVKESLNRNFDLNIGKDGRHKIWRSSLN